MTSNNYFLEYKEFIEGLKNNIMKIQLRYDECLNWVEIDYKKGILSEEDYQKLINARMDTYIPGYSEKYTLSKEDTEFIYEVADVDSDGKVLSTFLNNKFLRKEKLLDEIFQSVRIFAYYDSFDLEQRKLIFMDVVRKYYEEQLRNFVSKKDSLEKIHGDRVEKSSKYKEVCENIKTITYNLEALKGLVNCNENEIARLISDFYKIKPSHYEWYKKMSYKEEYESGFVYGEHATTMNDIGSEFNNSLIIQNNITSIHKDIVMLHKLLIDFFEKIGNIDSNQFNGVTYVKNGLFKKKELVNKDKLLLLFKELVKSPIAKIFIEQFDSEFIKNKEKNDEEKIADLELNIDVCFEEYFKKVYKDVNYVEIDRFILQFKKDVATYCKNSLSNLEKEFELQNRELERINNLEGRYINKGIRQTNLINEIHNGYNVNAAITLAGFKPQELEKMYNSLKAFIVNGFKFEGEELNTKKKV